MRDARTALMTGLVAALKTATSKSVYTRIPRSADASYPYILIANIYDEENGPKTKFHYRYDVEIQAIHMNLTSKSALYSDMNNIKSIINNNVPFALTDNFSIMECTLNSGTDTDFEVDSGVQSVGIVRAFFDIRDDA